MNSCLPEILCPFFEGVKLSSVRFRRLSIALSTLLVMSFMALGQNNDPTATGVPASITVTEDTESNADLGTTVFGDNDSATITVTLTVSDGTFSQPADGAGTGGGVTETLVSNSVVTLEGSPSDINAYLDVASNIKYTGPNNVFGNNSAAITITANDGDGSGDVNLGTVSIDITGVNDDPAFISTPISETIGIGDAYMRSAAVVDPDFDNIDFSGSTLPSWLNLTSKISLQVSEFAGSGTSGRNDGTGTNAEFESPGYLTVDPFGNIYLQNTSNIIKKITPEAVVTTVVPIEDGFRGVRGMVSDSQGNIFILEANNYAIHKLKPDGTHSIFVGTRGTFGVQDGTGTNASIRAVSDLVIDEQDNIYFVDEDGLSRSIRKITPQGVVTTEFTTTDPQFRAGTRSTLFHPDGYLLITDWVNDRLLKYDINTQLMSIFKNLDFEPAGMVIHPSGKILVSGNSRVYLVDENNATELAGGGPFFSNGIGAEASLSSPQGMDIGPNGEIYLATFNHRVRKLDIVSEAILTASAPEEGTHNITIKGSDSHGVVVDHDYTITVVDDVAPVITSTNAVLFAENATGEVLTVTATDTNALTYSIGSTGDNIQFSIDETTGVVTFNNPPDFENPIDTDTDNIYDISVNVTDTENNSTSQQIAITVTNENDLNPVFDTNPVLSIDEGQEYSYEYNATDPDGNAVSITAPTLPNWLTLNSSGGGGGNDMSFSTFVGGVSGDQDGTRTGAQINAPNRMTVDSNDNIFFIDGSNKLKKVSPDGVVSTVAGPDNRLSSTDPIVVDSDGTIHLFDKETGQFHEISNQGVISGGVSFRNITNIIDIALDENGSWLIMTSSSGTNRIHSGTALDETSIERQAFYDRTERARRPPRGQPPLPTPGFYEHSYFAVKSNGLIIWTALDANSTTVSLFSFDPSAFEGMDPPRGGFVPTKIADFPTINGNAFVPAGLAVDSNDDVFITSATDHNIYKLNTSNNTFEIYAGNSTADNVDGSGTQAAFNTPKGVVFDSDDKIYVSDNGNHAIRTEGGGVFIALSGTAPNIPGDYPVVLRATDGSGTTDQSFIITVNDVTDPVFTSGTAENFAENGTSTAHTVAATDASTLTYSLGAGNDEALFNIDGTTGVVTFVAAPDFENPADGNADNTYVVNVIATDAGNNAVNQNVTINVTDVSGEDAAGPVFTSGTAETFSENGNGTVHTAMATDVSSFSYGLGNGNDEALFTIDANTGVLTFINTPDFENPADGNTDNDYIVEIKATDQFNNETSRTVTITVTNVDEILPVFTSGTAVNFAENGTGTAYTVAATDANALTYGLGSSNDEGLFGIDSNTGVVTFNSAPDFENPADGNTDNAYVIEVTANDGLNTAMQTVTITVTDADEIGPGLTSSNPADDAIDFNGTSITFTFDENVLKGTGRISVFDAADDSEISGAGVGSTRVTVSGNTATLDLINPLPLDKHVYVNIPAGAFKDASNNNFGGLFGNTLLNFSSLTTPQLVSANPADDAVDFGGTILTFTFDRNIVKGTGRISVFDAADDSELSGAGMGSPRVTVSGNTLTFDLINPLPLDKQVYVRIPPSAIKDANDVFFSGILDNATLNFSSVSSPKLTSSTPADEAIDFNGTLLTFNFDRNIFKGTGRISVFDAADDSEISGAGVGSSRVTVSGNTLTFDLINPLPLDKQVYVNIPASAIKDGNDVFFNGILDNSTLNFASVTTPKLVSSNPADEAVDFGGTTITFTFDRNVFKGTGRISVRDAADDSEITGAGVGSTRVTVNNNVVVFDLVNPLPLDKQVYVNIPASAFKDASDVFYNGILDNTTLNFASASTPKLVSSNPADEAVEFGGTTITFTFDRNVFKGTGRISVRDVADDSEISGAGVGNARVTVNNNIVTFDLINPLPLDKQVYVNIPASAFKDVNDVFFKGILDNATLNFTSVSTPKLVSSNPVDEAVDFGGTTITFTFDRNVFKGTGRISVFDAADDSEITGAGVGSTRVTVNNKVVTFDLVNPLPLDKQVYVKIPASAIKDAGDVFYSGILDNTTLNFAAPTRPQLISSNPADGAADFSGTVLTFTFDKNMIKGTGRISVFNAADDTEITGAGVGSTRVTVTGNVVTFDLINAIPAGTSAYVRIPASALKDVNDIFYVGILDKTTLNFFTSVPPGPSTANITNDLSKVLSLKDELNITAYPNPVENQLRIDLSQMGDEPSVRVSGIDGVIRFSREKVKTQRLTIDVSGYAEGVYIVAAQNESGQVVYKKFMVVR